MEKNKIMTESESKARSEGFNNGREYQRDFKRYASAILFVGIRSPQRLEYLDSKVGDDFYVLPDGTEIKVVVPWYGDGKDRKDKPRKDELVGYDDEQLRGTDFHKPLIGYALVLGNTQGMAGQTRIFSPRVSDLAELVQKAESELPTVLGKHRIRCTKEDIKTYLDIVEVANS